MQSVSFESQTMPPTRMTITIDAEIYEVLKELADEEVRTPANLAAALVTKAVREIQSDRNKAK